MSIQMKINCGASFQRFVTVTKNFLKCLYLFCVAQSHKFYYIDASNYVSMFQGKYTDSSLKTSSRFEQLRDKFNKSNLGENEDTELALLRHINNVSI